MFCGGNKTLMSNITAPWWSELPRGWKEVFCNTEETKLKFSCVTLKNKISACKVALGIACEQALHLGESRFTSHKWRACQQAPLGRTIDNSAWLVSLVSSRLDHLFGGYSGWFVPIIPLTRFSLVSSSRPSRLFRASHWAIGKACRGGRRITTRASPHYHAPLVSGVLKFHNGVKLWGTRANRMKHERTSPNYGTAPGSFYSVVLLAVEVAIWKSQLESTVYFGVDFL